MTGFIRQISKATLIRRYRDVTRHKTKRVSTRINNNMADSNTHESLIGKLAPAFTLPNYNGEPFTFVPGGKGIPTAIFVYPVAQSYGCTQEACQFRDAVAEKDIFAPGKVQIIGLSADPVEKQKRFVEEQKLTYPVLSDTEKKVIGELKVGKGLGGFAPVGRVTYVVDKKGIVRATYGSMVNYGSHSVFVEKQLAALDEEDAAAAKEPTPTTTAQKL